MVSTTRHTAHRTLTTYIKPLKYYRGAKIGFAVAKTLPNLP
jgi:hypothetical protein